jgi:hypothetical protein
MIADLNNPAVRPAFVPPDASVTLALGREGPPPDAAAPLVADVRVSPLPVLLNGEVTVIATVDDTGKGGAKINGAEYSLDGGAWTSMDAADGAFDEVAEEVEAAFTPAPVGTHRVCVRGSDTATNTSAGDDCQAYLVAYQASAFAAPVDKIPVVNLAKAGQGVPVKWRLTDAKGVPITNPASFNSLLSYKVSCTDFQGDPADSVEEYAAGAGGLQYNGDGNWQFNWKTPKTYAAAPNNCRAMYVKFDSGGKSSAAFFQFN